MSFRMNMFLLKKCIQRLLNNYVLCMNSYLVISGIRHLALIMSVQHYCKIYVVRPDQLNVAWIRSLLFMANQK